MKNEKKDSYWIPNSEWTFAGIYADEGISGTSVDKRKEFMRLMRDCQKGKVDYILTKSTTRFARNTVDSLTWVRKLRAIGVGVMFEEQNLDSLKAENETFIGFYSVMAQSESESISGNVKWGVRKRMKNGTYKGNGCMCIDKTNHYEFTYDIDGDTLKVDYALDYVTDCEYAYTVDGDKLTLVGGNGTVEPGKVYELTKQE